MSRDAIIIGDGPTGLSCGLFLAKNDADVIVYGEDETPLHSAYLWNYLGILEEDGTAFQETSREQARKHGAQLEDARVETVEETEDGFRVTTEDGDEEQSTYLVVATGTDRSLGEELGLDYEGDVIRVDRDGRTSKENVYAGGWATRGTKIQVAISAGDGAAIALDILSKEEGKPLHDFDVPPEE